MKLDGQVAIVTGAGSPHGIGFACAKALAADGAHVVIASTTDRIHDRVAELDAQGWSATGFVGDLMVPACPRHWPPRLSRSPVASTSASTTPA